MILDAESDARAHLLLALMQRADPACDLAAVLAQVTEEGALYIAGLSCVTRADFIVSGEGVRGINVSVSEPTWATLSAMADRATVACAHIAEAAANTGLSILTGSTKGMRGPFTQPREIKELLLRISDLQKPVAI